ncbi:hypothetical protein [Streptomyces sp. NBC_00989]|uniref:hypothetical protein n=1 Tax=Streptomyces sp. NBC_00989 TaxID=2903705 RepID=UPI0038690B7E|nr:hypothetical protein OG714_20475 [Streptomyces sp. NBC_00989]
MLGDLAQAGTKALGGDRFSLLSVLPGAIVITAVTVLVGAHAYEPGRGMNLGDALPNDHKLVVLGLGSVGVFLGGVLLRPFEIALVQLLEGYWPAGSLRGRALPIAVERHRRLREQAIALDETRAVSPPNNASLTQLAQFHRAMAQERRIKERAERTAAKYSPYDEQLMPTALGNILKNVEERTGRRYGLDVLSAYRRIYPSVAPEFRQAIEEQMDLISIASSLCVAFGIVSLAASPLVFRMNWWTLLLPAAMAASAIAYRGAQRAAQDHEELMKAVFDVHRFNLASALHYDLPADAAGELDLNKRITTFLNASEPLAEDNGLKDEPLKHPPTA